MEDTLRGMLRHNKLQDMISLNPCFNGRYSQRPGLIDKVKPFTVLILVLMEDTLRDD